MHGRALILGVALYLALFVAVAAGWQGPDGEGDEFGDLLQRLIALQMVLLAAWHVIRLTLDRPRRRPE